MGIFGKVAQGATSLADDLLGMYKKQQKGAKPKTTPRSTRLEKAGYPEPMNTGPVSPGQSMVPYKKPPMSKKKKGALIAGGTGALAAATHARGDSTSPYHQPLGYTPMLSEGNPVGGYSSSAAQMRHSQIAPGMGINWQTGEEPSGIPRGFFQDPESETRWSYSNGRGGVARHVKPGGMDPQNRYLTGTAEEGPTGKERWSRLGTGDEVAWVAPSPSELYGGEDNPMPGSPEYAKKIHNEGEFEMPGMPGMPSLPRVPGMPDWMPGAGTMANAAWEFTGIPPTQRVLGQLTGQDLGEGTEVESPFDYIGPAEVAWWGPKLAAKGMKLSGKVGLKGGRKVGGKIWKQPKKWNAGDAQKTAREAQEKQQEEMWEEMLEDALTNPKP